MAYINSSTISDTNRIAQFLCDHMLGQNFLPYEDYHLIQKWLQKTTHIDHLLVILDELLSHDIATTQPVSLKSIHKYVLRRLKDTQR